MCRFSFEEGKPRERKPRDPKSPKVAQREVRKLLGGWRRTDKVVWGPHYPKSEDGILELFHKLTLGELLPETRGKMTCREILEMVAQRIDTDSQTQMMILAGACDLTLSSKMLGVSTVNRIMRLHFKDESDAVLAKIRIAASKCLRLQDILYRHGDVSLYAYILLEFRKPCLKTLSNFTDQHFSILEQVLRTESITFIKPETRLDSTCLRAPNVIYVLFGEKFRGGEVERCLMRFSDPVESKDVTPKRSPPFYTFMPLCGGLEDIRKRASKEIESMDPIAEHKQLKQYGQPKSCAELCRFVKNQAIMIGTVTESVGMRVVDFNRPVQSQAFELDFDCSMAAGESLALAVLLRDHDVKMKMVPDKQKQNKYPGDRVEDVEWKPDQILCYMDKALYAQDKENGLPFLVVTLEVKAIEPM